MHILVLFFLNTFAGEVVITSAECKTAPAHPHLLSNSPRWSTACVVAEAGGLTRVEACFLVTVLVTSLVTQELIRSLGGSRSASVQTLGMIPGTVLSARKVEQSFFSKSQFNLFHHALEILHLGAPLKCATHGASPGVQTQREPPLRRVQELMRLLAANVTVHVRMIELFSLYE